jgi:hypothetical protein
MIIGQKNEPKNKTRSITISNDSMGKCKNDDIIEDQQQRTTPTKNTSARQEVVDVLEFAVLGNKKAQAVLNSS